MYQDGSHHCERCQRRMRIVVMMGKTSAEARDTYINFIKTSGIAHSFDSTDIKVLCVCVCVCVYVCACMCMIYLCVVLRLR